MENERKEEQLEQTLPEEAVPQEEKPLYIPRPKWQVIGAWVALVLFVAVIVFYYLNMMRGG